MKSLKEKLSIGWLFVLLIAILVCIVVFFTGCNTQKHITKTKDTTDSLVIAQKDSQIEYLSRENTRLYSELRASQFGSVEFDSSKCPKLIPFVIPDNCDADSLKAILYRANDIIAELNMRNSGLKNKVEYYADGTFKAEGSIKKFLIQNEQLQKVLSYSQKEKDSIRKENNFLKEQITKEKTTVKVDKKSKSTLLSYLIVAVVTILLWEFLIRRYAINLINLFKTKK